MNATQTGAPCEVQRLREWMRARNCSLRRLAGEMGVPYQRLYHQMARRRIQDNTRWLFAQRYGWDVANEIFDAQGATKGEGDHVLA